MARMGLFETINIAPLLKNPKSLRLIPKNADEAMRDRSRIWSAG